MLDHLGITVRDHAGMHLCFTARDRGAFVIDPNGVNLEAVCHAPA